MGHDRNLLRLAGLAALTGSALRAATTFPQATIPFLEPEALYFLVDLLLMLGLVGMFAGLDRFRTALGVAGFAGAIAGFALVRTGVRVGPLGDYQTAAAVLGVALAVAGAALAQGGGLVRLAGLAWIGSLAIGLAGTLVHWAGGFLVASLLFCVGFALGGARLLAGDNGGH